MISTFLKEKAWFQMGIKKKNTPLSKVTVKNVNLQIKIVPECNLNKKYVTY